MACISVDRESEYLSDMMHSHDMPLEDGEASGILDTVGRRLPLIGDNTIHLYDSDWKWRLDISYDDGSDASLTGYGEFSGDLAFPLRIIHRVFERNGYPFPSALGPKRNYGPYLG